MGQCGCADGFGMFSFPGPDGTVYTFDTYAGCRDCDTPAGITIHRYRGSMLEFLQDDEPPPLPFRGVADDTEYGCFPLSMIDPKTLAKDIIEEVGDIEFQMNGEAWTLSELFDVESDMLLRAIQKNLHRTVEEWVKESEKFAKRERKEKA
jgi:hypothetical protein